MRARKRGGLMRMRRAKTGSDSAPAGRHRLPRNAGLPVPAPTPLISSCDAATDDDGFDGQDLATAGDVSADVNHAADEAAAIEASPPVDSRWGRIIAYGLLPTLTVMLGGGAGYLTWGAISAHFVRQARVESVRAATDGTMELLTYRPDTVGKDLGAARELLTGKFKASYTLFTRQQVIPDARAKHVSSVVTVPAAALVRATIDHAVVMVFVNQTFLREPDPPTSYASDVQVTLDKVGRRWLISEFTPV